MGGRRRGPVSVVALCLLVLGCSEATERLNDVGKVKATFYRHKLPPTASAVGMPGERLGPATTCGAATQSGVFDPCRPDADPSNLDAAGNPRITTPAAAAPPAARRPAAAARAVVTPKPKPARPQVRRVDHKPSAARHATKRKRPR
ncbi:MAG: hypothetical protein AB7P02_04840 [Alphaproteobacteria bacterium]